MAVVAAVVKIKLCRHKSLRLRWGMECWASILTLTFGANGTAELKAPFDGRSLTPKELFVLISVGG